MSAHFSLYNRKKLHRAVLKHIEFNILLYLFCITICTIVCTEVSYVFYAKIENTATHNMNFAMLQVVRVFLVHCTLSDKVV